MAEWQGGRVNFSVPYIVLWPGTLQPGNPATPPPNVRNTYELGSLAQRVLKSA